MNKKIVIDCEGAVEHVKWVLHEVEEYLKEGFGNEYSIAIVGKAISDNCDDCAEEMSPDERIALIGCYGLDNAYNEYREDHGAYDGNDLSQLMCYHILFTQFYKTKLSIIHKLFSKEGEFEVIVRQQ
jgi:hypothetical protein